MSLGDHDLCFLLPSEGLAYLRDEVATSELWPLKMKLIRVFPGLSFKTTFFSIVSGICFQFVLNVPRNWTFIL